MGSKVGNITRRGFQAGRGVAEVVRIGVVTIGSISISQNKGISRAKLLDMVYGDSNIVRIRAITCTDKEGGDV